MKILNTSVDLKYLCADVLIGVDYVEISIRVLSARLRIEFDFGRPKAWLSPLSVYVFNRSDAICFGPFTVVFGMTDSWVTWEMETDE